MMRTTLSLAALLGLATAQMGAPDNTSICDYYTGALLKENTAENQATVLTLIVNTVIIGNYTKPEIEGVTFPDVAVPGILAPGNVDGEDVNLLPYFNGGLASSNRGGSSGVAVNFLDDGGAAPLMANMPANGTSSAQYRLVTHLYQFFGALLGCSAQGNDAFPAYTGAASQYQVHKFMALSNAEVTYFIQQVGLSASSFGVVDSDITKVADALSGLFNLRCAPAAEVIPGQGAELQAICIDDSCEQAPEPACDEYEAVVEPGVANATLAQGEGNATSTATASAGAGSGEPSASATGMSPSAAPSEPAAGRAGKVEAGVVVVGGLVAAALLL